MENFQAANLVVGILFLARAVRNSASHSDRRLFLGGLIIFYSTLALLEFDVREFHISWLTWLLNGGPRNVWLACVWLGAFGLFLRRARTTWMEFLAWLYRPSAALLLLAGSFWAVGWLIDHLKFFSTFDQNLMAEELMEAIAAPLMLASAILTWRMTTKPRAGHVMVNTGLPRSPEQPKGINKE